ncbi:hypothetical protein NECID01_1388 [Nematocida sp. AWRm77]|nr:hypothetical protein NECID01_1388 [Nematocida sp. AWRm77]
MKSSSSSSEQSLSPQSPQSLLRLFEFASAGDLKSLRNTLCVYEISHGKMLDLKVVNKFGLYLIHSAAYYGQKDVVEFLLSSVSEVEEKDVLLFESVATDNMSFDSTETELSQETVPVPSAVSFMHAKPSTSFINIRSCDYGATPLHFAAIGGNKNNIILYLLSCGADPTLKDVKGNTPQDAARNHGHKKTEKIIRKYIDQINKTVSKEKSALSI